MRYLSLIILLWAGVFAGVSAAPERPQTLEDLLGGAEYRAMGLDKLSPAEQERLLAWILRTRETREVPLGTPRVSFGVGAPTRAPGTDAADSVSVTERREAQVSVAPAPSPAPTPAAAAQAQEIATETRLFGIEQTDQGMQVIRARIVGEFTGWDGRTQFVLDNGQVWRQSTPGTYKHRATDPEVTITRALVGYKLRLTDTRRSINVRRVK